MGAMLFHPDRSGSCSSSNRRSRHVPADWQYVRHRGRAILRSGCVCARHRTGQSGSETGRVCVRRGIDIGGVLGTGVPQMVYFKRAMFRVGCFAAPMPPYGFSPDFVHRSPVPAILSVCLYNQLLGFGAQGPGRRAFSALAGATDWGVSIERGAFPVTNSMICRG